MMAMADFFFFLVVAGAAGICVSQRWWGLATFETLLALHALVKSIIA